MSSNAISPILASAGVRTTVGNKGRTLEADNKGRTLHTTAQTKAEH